MFLITKLGEDLKTWTGSTKSDKILGLTVWSETYEMTKFQKSYSCETMWGGSQDHVEFGRI